MARLLAMATAGALLAACGGGTTDAPEILSFTADRSSAYVGESVRLSAAYQGSQGRVEPGLGTLPSGRSLDSGVLDRDTRFKLIVETPGKASASRTLDMPVQFRNRYARTASGLQVSEHATAAAGDGSVLFIGGSRGEGMLSRSVDRYDPASGQFSHLGDLATGRVDALATRLPDGRVLVSGGSTAAGDGRLVELVDERSGEVRATGALSVARLYHAALLLPDGRVLVSGGQSKGERAGLPLSNSAELWEPTTQRFRRITQRMSGGRAGHTMSLLADGRVLIVGGYTNGSEARFAEIFDPRDESFTSLAAQQPLRANHAAHVDAQGRVLILGGETPDARGNPVPLAGVLRYDPASRAFAALPALREPRTLAGSVLLPSGRVLLFGGEDARLRSSASAESYDPVLGTQAIAALDSPRALHSVTRLPSGRVLVAGGVDADGRYVSTTLLYE